MLLRLQPLNIKRQKPGPSGIICYFQDEHVGEGSTQTPLIRAYLHDMLCRQPQARCNFVLVPLYVASGCPLPHVPLTSHRSERHEIDWISSLLTVFHSFNPWEKHDLFFFACAV